MSKPLPPEDERLSAGRKRHPQLRGRIERLVGLVEDGVRTYTRRMRRAACDCRGAATRPRGAGGLGQRTSQQTLGSLGSSARGLARGLKKLCWHSTFGDIEVDEPQYREGTQRRRPFAQSAEVHHRGCSRPLQRVVTDLGADLAFAQAAGKLQEHYGVILSPSTIRQVTEGHARALIGDAGAEPAWPTQAGAAIVIAEIDGGMVPLVEVDPDRPDRRRGKRLLWKEAKLSLAHAHGSTTRVYGATLGGGVEVAGRQLLACAIAAGLGTNSQVHALGDGAVWIADQVAARFATQG